LLNSVNALIPGTYYTYLPFYTYNYNVQDQIWVPITLILSGPPPMLKTNANRLAFQYTVGGPTPSTQGIQITSTSTPLTTTVSVSSQWLTATPSTGTTPLTLNVGVNPTGLDPGTYTGQVTITTTPLQASSTQTVTVSPTLTSDTRPNITSVLNGASFLPQGIGPGSWISIMGSNLASGTAQASTAFPMSLNGVSVQLSGPGAAYSLLLSYVSPSQVNASIPIELAPTLFDDSCNVTVVTPTGTSFVQHKLPSSDPRFVPWCSRLCDCGTHRLEYGRRDYRFNSSESW
jgi:hypothetical protein